MKLVACSVLMVCCFQSLVFLKWFNSFIVILSLLHNTNYYSPATDTPTEHQFTRYDQICNKIRLILRHLKEVDVM